MMKRILMGITVSLLGLGLMNGVKGQNGRTGTRSKMVGKQPEAKPVDRLVNHALLIYVQEYDDRSLNLNYPQSDVERLKSVLLARYDYDETNVGVLANPGREELFNRLQEYAERMTAQDTLLIFYAGHGYWDEKIRQGYWYPKNARKENRANWISNGDIRDVIRSIKCRHTLLVADACFSGSLLRDPPENQIRSKGIEELIRIQSRRAITSGALTTVPDRSPFVDYLVKRLESNEDEYLRAGTLFERLQVPVINNSTTRQTPQYGAIPETEDEGGQFIFVRRGRSEAGEAVTTAAPAPTPTPDPEAEAWKVVAISNNVEVVRDFIKYFPGGRYIGAAQVKLKELEIKASSTVVETRKAKSMLTPTAFTAGTIVDGKLIRKQGECEVYEEDLGNGVRLEMVRIPGGKFRMGSPESEDRRATDEGPQREVNVTEFLMGRHEVTQRVWREVAGYPKVGRELNSDPSGFKGEDRPVEKVSWEEVKEFIARLNRKLGLREREGYRLPSEAEWEYAARAGTGTPYGFGETIDAEIVNYNGNYPYGKGKKGQYRERTVSVGSLGVANGWGLYDMHGNVWEWCEDEYHSNYDGAPVDGGAWVSSAQAAIRVVRGGGWSDFAVICRSADRDWYSPGYRGNLVGFRLSRTLP